MFKLRTGTDLILASGSPRRKKILEDMGLHFRIQKPDIEEVRLKDESPEKYASRLAFEKAQKVAMEFPTSWILAADTDVFIDGEVLGKPVDEDDAFRLLRLISGRDHSVWSSFALLCEDLGKNCVVASESVVSISKLSDEDIWSYIATGEPMDKAGAYAAQGIASSFINKITGNYDSIVGLDSCKLREKLLEFGLLVYG
ncbi:MAG: septum formation protein Maf [Bdellovibrionales bacterium]|nr:septum formation protein Maf [Bdellovibrionales bacterium]